MKRCRLFMAIVIMGCSLGAGAAGRDAVGDGAQPGAGARPSYGVGHPGSLAWGSNNAGVGTPSPGSTPLMTTAWAE